MKLNRDSLEWLTEDIITSVGVTQCLLYTTRSNSHEEFKELVMTEYNRKKQSNDKIRRDFDFLTVIDLTECIKEVDGNPELFSDLLHKRAEERTKRPLMNLGWLTPGDLNKVMTMNFRGLDENTAIVNALIKLRMQQADEKSK